MTHRQEDEQIDWVLLARYFAGELSAEERREVDEWVVADPARAEEVASLRRLWERAGLLPTPSRVDALWGNVAGRMHAQPQPAIDARRVARPSRWRVTRTHGVLAAALAVAVLGGGVWRAVALDRAPAAAADPVRRYETGRGQTANVQLTDGTRVTLAPASLLEVRSFERDGPRELELVGEAVFHVTHDETRPFLVHSGNAIAEDLGTIFAVRSYPGDERVNVLVVEGRVALRDADAPAHSGTILESGQGGQVDLAGQVVIVPAADPERRLAWSRGRVVFNQLPLREVAIELERRYDVDLEIPDSSVADRRITIDIPAGRLSDVLDAVAVPLNLRVERNGDLIRLHP